jgi:hypothetical protein
VSRQKSAIKKLFEKEKAGVKMEIAATILLIVFVLTIVALMGFL